MGLLGSSRVDPTLVRRRFATRLRGHGVEIGPGHVPFPVGPQVRVRFVDRWRPEENRALFPELGEDAGFPPVDIVADLDADGLAALADESEDFVIASHILEHLANPLAVLVEIHRVLRPGGLLVLILPDRRFSYDRFRPATTLEHLVEEYHRDVRQVDDAHVVEAIVAQVLFNGDADCEPARIAAAQTPELIEMHRRRSVHVHSWEMAPFEHVLRFAEQEVGEAWTVLDSMVPEEEGTHGNEFGWLLARPERRRRLLRRRG